MWFSDFWSFGSAEVASRSGVWVDVALSAEVVATVVVVEVFFFLRFLSMPAFFAPLSFRPPPVDV